MTEYGERRTTERHAPTPGERKDLSGPALRAFFRIADLWRLTVAEQMTLLGLTAASTFYKWRKDPPATVLPKDTLERISYLLGIYRALQILLPDPKAADEWPRRPNGAAIFGGRSALDRMLSGQVADLFVVRQYLDAERGGWS
ncbi:MAG: antitoxin Xre-like helix-turn-helix domain-containing protein [Alphaproteobacteria bacterium]